MSRHRNVRSMNYEDEYFDEDDVYGHSIEDNYCISPGTAAQFTYNRDRNVALSNFMDEQGGIPEEDEEGDTDDGTPRDQHRGSQDYVRPKLTDVDEAKLNSVLEEVRNVLGEAVPEGIMVDTILRRNFSVEGTLNELLNQQEAPKPQREPRRDRRNRSQELDDEIETDGCLDNNVFSNIPETTGGVLKFGDSVSPKSPSFLMKSKVPVNNTSDSIIVTRQCAFVSSPINVASVTAKKVSNGNAVSSLRETAELEQLSHDAVCDTESQFQQSVFKSNTRKSLQDTQSGLEFSDQSTDIKSEKQETESRSKTTLNIKESLSALTKEHGIVIKEGMAKSLAETVKVNDKERNPRSGHSFNLGNSQVKLQENKHNSLEKDLMSNVLPGSKLVTLSDLTKQNRCWSETGGKLSQQTVKTGGLSLADLAKSHHVTRGNSEDTGIKPGLTLSDLAKKHSENTSSIENQSSKSLSDLAKNLSPGAIHKNTLSKPSNTSSKLSPSLADLAAGPLNKCQETLVSKTGENKSASSLASLATVHLSSAQSPSVEVPKSEAGLNSSSVPLNITSPSSLIVSKSPSGSSSGKSPLGMSLSQLAEAHGIKKSPLSNDAKESNNSCENKENQKSVSMLSSEVFKNKTDKEQIMLSLSNLVDKHGKSESRLIVSRQNASLSRHDINKLEDNFADICKQNVHTGETTEKRPVKVPAISLADLAKARNTQALKDAKTKDNIFTGTLIKKPETATGKNNGKETSAATDTEKVIREDAGKLEANLKLNDDMQFETVKNLILKHPSSVGNTLCLGIKISKGKRYKIKKFCYCYQLKGQKENFQVEMSQVMPFDFSTPSPDDLVKAKQKQAFNRNGK